MGLFRKLVRQRRSLAILLVVCALFAKTVIPAGFMPVAISRRIVIEICSGTGPMTMAAPMSASMAVPGMPTHQDKPKNGKPESPCTFAGLSAPLLAGADPVLLSLAIMFVMAMGLLAARAVALPLAAYLRPPLRGPPATA